MQRQFRKRIFEQLGFVRIYSQWNYLFFDGTVYDVSKSSLLKDEEIAEKILATTDVAVIKALGRQVKGYNDGYWNGVRQLLVYEGLKEKFTQNENLKKLLLDTEDSILAEGAVNDRIWGIGLSMKDSNRLESEKWRGQNLLGYAMMMVRNWIKE